MAAMTIGKLAEAGGVGVETIRYYQRRGLLSEPERTGGSGLGGGVRRYDEDDVRRLKFIRAAQTAGFTLDEIGELLALDATETRARVQALARQRIAALDQRIAELIAAREALGRLADRCAATQQGACPILAAFEP
jgi:MerR family mercuric resistance operon transcriptional regulator